MLDGIVALDVQRQRLGAQVPGNTLGARWSGEGAGVLVDAVISQVLGQIGEVQRTNLGECARCSNVIYMSKDRIEQRSRIAVLGQLKEETDDSNRGWGSLAYRHDNGDIEESVDEGTNGFQCLPEFSKTK